MAAPNTKTQLSMARTDQERNQQTVAQITSNPFLRAIRAGELSAAQARIAGRQKTIDELQKRLDTEIASAKAANAAKAANVAKATNAAKAAANAAKTAANAAKTAANATATRRAQNTTTNIGGRQKMPNVTMVSKSANAAAAQATNAQKQAEMAKKQAAELAASLNKIADLQKQLDAATKRAVLPPNTVPVPTGMVGGIQQTLERMSGDLKKVMQNPPKGGGRTRRASRSRRH